LSSGLSSGVLSWIVWNVCGSPLVTNSELKRQVNPEELGGGFEGDMILPTAAERGVAIRGAGYRWKNAVIPYDLSGITDQAHKDMILSSMKRLMWDVATPTSSTSRSVCVIFREKTAEDKNFLKAQYGDGCSCSVGGYEGHEKILTLDPPAPGKAHCFFEGTIIHELTHALGFFHEQSRPDRDDHLIVQKANIIPGMEHNFNKYEWNDQVEDLGTPYDYNSLMHYGQTSFTSNGQPTMIPKKADAKIGQREKLSDIDIAEIRKYYNCKP